MRAANRITSTAACIGSSIASHITTAACAADGGYASLIARPSSTSGVQFSVFLAEFSRCCSLPRASSATT